MSKHHNRFDKVKLVVYCLILTLILSVLAIIGINLMLGQNDTSCSGPGFADGCTGGFVGFAASVVGLAFIFGLIVAVVMLFREIRKILKS